MILPLTQWFLRLCYLVSSYLWSFLILCCNWFLVSFHCATKDSRYDVSLLQFVRSLLWHNMWSILENILFSLETSVNYSATGWKVLCMSVRSICLKCCLGPLVVYWFLSQCSIHCWKSGIEMLTIVLHSISPFTSVNVCFTYLDDLILDVYK